MSYVNDIASHGFAVLEDVVNSETVSLLLREVANARIDNLEKQRWSNDNEASITSLINHCESTSAPARAAL